MTKTTRNVRSQRAMLRHSLAAAVFALLPFGVSAQQKEAPPAPAPAKNVTLPQPVRFTLPNGLGVTLIEFGAVPKVAVQVAVRAGNVDENADQIWLADIMGDMLREGTTSKSGNDISTEVASMGGTLNIGVGLDETTIGGEALSEFAPALVRLIADVAMNPRFPESEMARIKSNRLRNLAVARSQPQTLAQEKFMQVMYGEHPYGRLFPTEPMIQGYTVADVRAFYDANFNASRADVFVVGRFDRAAVEQAIRSAFTGWRAGSPDAPDPTAHQPAPRIHIIDRPGAVQSSMYIGVPLVDPTHPDYIPLTVTNALLGGSFGSRITRNIREDKGYTYSPFSTISTRYRNGYWAEIADVTTAVTGASISEIFKEIDRLSNEPPAADELRGIQNYLAGTFTLGAASRFGLLGQMRTLNLHGLPETYLTNYVQNVYAVTPQQVQEMTRKYLQKDDMVIVIVGDRKQILEQVSPFGEIAGS